MNSWRPDFHSSPKVSLPASAAAASPGALPSEAAPLLPASPPLPAAGILGLWHEHLPALLPVFAHRNIAVLISQSRDGEWAARACHRFGYRVFRGSDSRGSVALRHLARALEGPFPLVGMALDGPRGPRRRAKPGLLWLTGRKDLPFFPLAVSAGPAFRLSSWDRALVPWPFARIAVRLGSPLFPRSPAEVEEAMAREEKALAAAENPADARGALF